ncbi:hypothetical protein [Aestuariirhabdus sp. LZHN29]|uniref:hypothetical protein n=1 Tax=Aestuariirhabdus sp. LZHN29 TaxID=3417462 RepID=UPI003CE89209
MIKGKGEPSCIAKALEGAQESGLIERLVSQCWGESLQALDYGQRLRLELETPP